MQISCINNLKTLNLGHILYANDYDDMVPAGYSGGRFWPTALEYAGVLMAPPEFGEKSDWVCPANVHVPSSSSCFSSYARIRNTPH